MKNLEEPLKTLTESMQINKTTTLRPSDDVSKLLFFFIYIFYFSSCSKCCAISNLGKNIFQSFPDERSPSPDQGRFRLHPKNPKKIKKKKKNPRSVYDTYPNLKTKSRNLFDSVTEDQDL